MKVNPEFLLNYYSTCEEIGGMDSAINPFNVNQYDENNQPIFELDDDDDGED
jgi:hypothetical protein